jgi:hypothetical protein
MFSSSKDDPKAEVPIMEATVTTWETAKRIMNRTLIEAEQQHSGRRNST